MRERKKRDIIAIGILATVIAVIPLFTSSRYVFSMCISIFTMAAFGTAWNIIGGYAGQIGFAHSAFFSIGAYSGVLCYLKLGISPWWGLLLGLAISLLASLFIGTITLRYKGTYFMFCTIAFTKCIEVLLLWKKELTGGAGGLVIPIKGNHFSLLIFKDTRYYYARHQGGHSRGGVARHRVEGLQDSGVFDQLGDCVRDRNHLRVLHGLY